MKWILTVGLGLFLLVPFASATSDSEKIEILREIYRYPDSEWLRAIVEVESNYDRRATSHCGALGLFQIMPRYWDKELRKAGIIEKRADYHSIKKGVEAGHYVWQKIKREKKGIRPFLVKYSGGAKGYVEKVLRKMAK